MVCEEVAYVIAWAGEDMAEMVLRNERFTKVYILSSHIP